MKRLLTVLCAASVLALAGCGPKAFVKGSYDKDVTAENNLNDQWSETDMQVVVKDLVASMTKARAINDAKRPPIVMVTKLQNKTDEHIDTQSVMDMIRVELAREGKVAFVDKEAREDVAGEYDYQNSGMVSNETKKGPGGQTGADFIINGRLDSIVQQVGKEKTIFYKVTLNLTNLQTNVVAWSDYKQLRKLYKKKSIGL